MDHQWVQVQGHIIHYLVILIKVLHLDISKVHGMALVLMVRLDRPGDLVDLVVHLNRDLLDQGQDNTDHQGWYVSSANSLSCSLMGKFNVMSIFNIISSCMFNVIIDIAQVFYLR